MQQERNQEADEFQNGGGYHLKIKNFLGKIFKC